MRNKLRTAAVAALATAGAFAAVAASGGTADAATTGVQHSWSGASRPTTSVTIHPKAALAGSDQFGCTSGWVCIMDPHTGTIVHAYFTYGAHNIANPFLFGTYFVDNNQTAHAKAALCTGSNGTGCGTFFAAPHSGLADMTPINSVVLKP
jgi:hypothetical protein